MSMFGENGFDANAPENNVSNVIPKGNYQAVLVNSKVEKTKDGRGARLNLDFQILHGEYMNKHVFEGLNLWLRRNEFNSESEWKAALSSDQKTKTAVDIANAQLSAICKAVNVLSPKDSYELHNKELTIAVGVQEAKDGFPARNKITAYKPKSVQVAAPPPPPPVNSGAGQSSNSPW